MATQGDPKFKVGDVVKLPDRRLPGRGDWRPYGEKGVVTEVHVDHLHADIIVHFLGGYVDNYLPHELIWVESGA